MNTISKSDLQRNLNFKAALNDIAEAQAKLASAYMALSKIDAAEAMNAAHKQRPSQEFPMTSINMDALEDMHQDMSFYFSKLNEFFTTVQITEQG